MPIVILVVLVVVVGVVVAVVRSRGGDDDATGTVDVERRLTSTVQPVGLVGDPTAKKVEEPAKPAPLPTMPAVSRKAAAESGAVDAGTTARQEDPVVFEPDLSRFDGSSAERKPIDLPWPDVDGPPKHAPAEPAGSEPAASATVDEPATGDAATPGDQSAAVGDDSADLGRPAEEASQGATVEVEKAATEADDAGSVELEPSEAEAAQAPESNAPVTEAATEAAGVPSEDESSTVEQVVAAVDGDAQPAEDEVTGVAEVTEVTEEAVEDEATGDVVATTDESEEAESAETAEEPAVAAVDGAEAGEASDVDGGDEPPADDEVVIDLVETEMAQLQPEPDPVDQVLNALINRARQRNVGVAEVAAELVEQAALEDREVDEVLADLVVRSEDEADVHTSHRLTELTFFNDAVPRRPGELSQFERLGDTEKKRVIIRVLCLLVAQAEDSHMRPREPRSEAETRSWPLARAIWPVQTAEEPDDADLPARPVARSGR